MPVHLTCAHCGAAFSRPPCRADSTYCTRDCRRAARSVRVPCFTCGATLERYRSMVVSERCYCSKRCKGAAARYSIDQFWALVHKDDDCWGWTGRRSTDGYGLFVLERRRWRAHRLAWTLTCGPIPDGLFVCHRCDRVLCVRPDHLFLGTNDDNQRDMRDKGRGQPPPHVRGEDCSFAVLSEDEVREIRRLYATFGWGYFRLARRFGVSVSTVAQIVTRRTWRHLE